MMPDDPKLPWRSAVAKVGQYLVLPGDEVAEVITIPEVKPGKVPVAWATVRESVHKSRIGQTLIVSLFSIVEGAPQPGQVQLKKSLAEVVVVKPVEVKDLTKLSPIEYALWVESDGRITQDMRDLAGKYEDLSDKKLVSLLEERGLSTAGISYAHDGPPENYVKSKGLFLKLQRPSIIARIAYHEAKGRERVPTRREIQVKPEPEKPKFEKKEAEAKEPWQMTSDNYMDIKMEELRSSKMYSNAPRQYQQQLVKEGEAKFYDEWIQANEQAFIEGNRVQYTPEWALTAEQAATRSDDILDKTFIEGHKKYVSQALSEGKPVPAEVLKDYPELARPVETRPPEPTVHYGPPESASAEVKVQWNRMLGEVRRQYPLGEPVLENEAKRLGITPKEMQLMIAKERWGGRK